MKKRGGMYWVNGKPYASVTAIISVLDKPALRYWFGQQVYRAFSADETLSEKEALSAPWKVSGKAKERGSTVHSIVEAWKQSKKHIKTVPEPFKGYAKAFYDWIADNKVEVLVNEKQVVSKLHGYAGTLDLIIKVNGSKKAMIVDVKTGKGIYDEVWLQLSAYRKALSEEKLIYSLCDIACLLLKEDGTYQFAKGEDRFKEFLACKTIWEWQNKEKMEQLTIKFKKGGK